MIEVQQIATPIETPLSKEIVAKKLKCSLSDILHCKILKESIDARKNNIVFIYSVAVDVKNERKYTSLPFVKPYKENYYPIQKLSTPLSYRPIVVGFGPAGMFAALTLAKAGCRPIILERGSQVEKRVNDVQEFWNHGILNPESNVQFGEGGAGTFSDGKLTTRIKDNRVQVVLNALVKAGADPSIMYQAHPHLGTDKLVHIVKNIRETIISLGGEIHFNTKFNSFTCLEGNKKKIHTSKQDFETEALFLCLGHSAKDTISFLHQENVLIEPKSFAIGLRIEHKQDFINHSQYGKWANHPRLGAAEYRLSHTAENGRGVYSFCMCPGGEVVPSSSEDGKLVVNGMSKSQRNLDNANSALLVQVPISDFYHSSPLDGFSYQEKLEEKAFILGGSNYKAPAQLVQDYIKNISSSQFNTVVPSYCLGVSLTNLRSLFTDEINEALVEGLLHFDKKIKGFSSGDAILTGIETRSSCPIRIPRNEKLESMSHPFVFPVGEGAGYAGGIVSSAVDGIRCAEQFIQSQNKNKP